MEKIVFSMKMDQMSRKLHVLRKNSSLLFTHLSLRDAAQEGALYGSLAPPDTDVIRARVRDSSGWPVDFSTFSDAQIQVSITGPACAGSDIKVTLQMDFLMAAPFIGGQTLPLVAEAIDTILQPPC